MPVSPGDKLGPYEVLAPIGAGGMGEVWKARDPRLDRAVAIKRLKPEHGVRFQHEARAIAALNHPHICQIYDVGPDYLVLEFLEGAPLKGPLAPAEAVRVALQIAGALETAHAKGILHRDLKPANILMTAAGPKLLDFGLAKLVNDGDVTQTIGVSGTPMYMSPEQAEGKPVDARSDIFSFGTVLYELLSGKRAFDSLGAVLRDTPAKIHVAPELEAVVARCLAKSPVQRFQNMADLRAELERAAAHAGKLANAAPSIAVLPFANMSRDADDEYFSDGLAEEIINALVKVPGLKVIARTSAFAFKGQNTDIRKIAEILGVTNVLEGSVRRAGNRIRVTAQLITAADGTHLWSERYDRQMEDLFAMQDEIAAAIAGELKLKFAPDPAARPRHQPNLQAYEAYLRYRQYQWGFTPESLRRSRECLEQAIALDPEFALPYAGLADHTFANVVANVPIREVDARIRELAQKALTLDPDLPEAHGTLGNVAGTCDYDWQEAERRFRLAMAREPVHWHVREWYSCFFLLVVGRLEEARRETERALKDNPLSAILYWNVAAVQMALGQEAEALAAWKKTVELDPQFWLGWAGLARHQALLGMHAESIQSAESALALFPDAAQAVGVLAGVLRITGETARSADVLARMPDGHPGCAQMRANFHLICGEADAALQWAEAAAKTNPIVVLDFTRPVANRLASSARWPAWLRKLNLS